MHYSCDNNTVLRTLRDLEFFTAKTNACANLIQVFIETLPGESDFFGYELALHSLRKIDSQMYLTCTSVRHIFYKGVVLFPALLSTDFYNIGQKRGWIDARKRNPKGTP